MSGIDNAHLFPNSMMAAAAHLGQSRLRSVSGLDSGSSVPPNYRMVAMPGRLNLTGQNATLTYTPVVLNNYVLTAQAGMLALNGQSATLTKAAPPLLSVEAISPIAHNDSIAVLTNTITTLTPNAIIILVWQTNAGQLVGPPTAPGLTFALGFNGPPGNANVGYFWAKAATPGTYTITSTGNFASYFSTVAFSVAGAPSAKFDGPVVDMIAEPLVYTPTNPNDIVFVGWVVGVDNPSAGAGWTQILGQNFFLVEYQIVSSTAPVSATIGAGAGNGSRGFIHGLMAG
jgi:hypothetical protein